MNLLKTERIYWKRSLPFTSFNLNLLKLALVKTDPFLVGICENHSVHCFARAVLRINYPIQTPGTEGISRQDAWGILCDNMCPQKPLTPKLDFPSWTLLASWYSVPQGNNLTSKSIEGEGVDSLESELIFYSCQELKYVGVRWITLVMGKQQTP